MTPATPTLVYDADCGFCTRSARWLAARGNLDVVASQSLDLDEDARRAVQDAAAWQVGGRFQAWGAHAIAAALLARGGWSGGVGRLLAAPGLSVLADVVYRWVASHRHLMPGGTSTCGMSPS